MVSRTETGEDIVDKDDQLTVKAQDRRKRFDQNYGAMMIVMQYLPRIEQLSLQGLDKWQYTIGVSRVQVRLETGKMFYFYISGKSQIMAVCKSGECERFEFRGEKSDLGRYTWFSCQVGQHRLFQVDKSNFRILKMNRSERSFTIETVQESPNCNTTTLG